MEIFLGVREYKIVFKNSGVGFFIVFSNLKLLVSKYYFSVEEALYELTDTVKVGELYRSKIIQTFF